MAAPIAKYDGDAIGATVTFGYKGPAASYNIGVIVETKPNVIFMMKDHQCPATGGAWVGQSVSVDGIWAASFLDHGDLVTCLMVIYPATMPPLPNGTNSLYKQSSGDIYVHQLETPPEPPPPPPPPPDEPDWWEGIVDWLNDYWYVVMIAAILIIIMVFVVTKR